jgi:uncharacterized membrane protein YjjP (DUF1212 family)
VCCPQSRCTSLSRCFRKGAESSARWKILFIAIGSAVASVAIRLLISGLAGSLLGFVVAFALIVVALIFWCGIDRKAALKITAAYFAFTAALAIVTMYLGSVAARS